jgi:type VI secretion system protein ImpG
MGRLRHKLDDELPELTEGLVSMLWPHYLRMIPSLSILEMTPDLGALQRHEVLPAGLEVTSDPIALDSQVDGSGERVECIYRTTQPVDLYPLRLTEAGAYTREDGRSVIRLRLALQTQGRREQLSCRVCGSIFMATADCAGALCGVDREAAGAAGSIPDSPANSALADPKIGESGESGRRGGRAHRVRCQACIWNQRIRRKRTAVAKADNAFGGYQLLLEYFAFPRNSCSWILWDSIWTQFPDAPHVDVEVVLAKPFPDDMRFSAENVRLFCTPIINLFELEADPVTINHFETEYRVRMEQHGSMSTLLGRNRAGLRGGQRPALRIRAVRGIPPSWRHAAS